MKRRSLLTMIGAAFASPLATLTDPKPVALQASAGAINLAPGHGFTVGDHITFDCFKGWDGKAPHVFVVTRVDRDTLELNYPARLEA